ncbi:LysE family translocator [Alterisphingorhabdus coralli]|uniref:LysE family translocator n=1 Tax=Alterisphingorhabdus coralli TaxID=3071408 RepID=A0AA97F7R4_9SPHN|nr:LysE family translocator [Parasphingorhabdus sp. SCSIO 66989]WOE74828.1 LysE family translocator [Parasphingorhabdus sp. SCSIO 66989]
MPIETLIAFILTDLAFCLVPGPAVMITVSHVLSGGGRNAIGPILGINFGNFVWYGLSALGLMALASTAPIAFAIIQYVGAAYLIWLGWKRLRVDAMAPVLAPAMGNGTIGSGIASGFASGIAVHMANPKALLFYTTVLPQFLDAERPLAPQMLTLMLATVFTETTSLSIYSIIAARGGAIARDVGRTHLLNRIAGVILIAVAIALLVVNAMPDGQ